jgi:hypothetical protein
VHVCCGKRWRLKRHRCNLKEEEKNMKRVMSHREWWGTTTNTTVYNTPI